MVIDDIDLEIIDILREEGRITYTDLAGRTGLTGPSIAERVRRLESQGVIRSFTARLDPAAVGLTLTAFIAVGLTGSGDRAAFLDAVAAIDEVVECHHLAGEDDYLLKVHVAGTQDLERLISDDLRAVPHVARTRTMIALSTPLERDLRIPRRT